MTTKLKRCLAVILGAVVAVVVFSIVYVRTHPLVFNESFFQHAHCIVGGGLSLGNYASTNGGRYPFHTNSYGDALVMMNSGWDFALTGPGFDAAVFERVRRTGEDAPEREFGRVYVQGLSDTNDPQIALLFDKIPTPGGDHCHLFSRLFAPLGREVWTIGITRIRRFVRESDWPAYAKEQIELLIAAGIAREQAERYYSEEPKK